ncbi:MAG: CsbD family protein [Microbacteriaceae bacterium]|nr:CsbD family protein [Microbacteriaceae bacterium]
MTDRMEHKGEDLKGRAKEAAGAVTDNDDLRRDGKGDQAAAGFKEKVDDVRDGITDAVDKLRGKD